MENTSPARLRQLIATVPGLVSALDEATLNLRPAPGKWSKKEILGHLIDSAANNHQRIIRAQYEDTPNISYDPDEWVRLNRYGALDAARVIAFWELYNLHLLEVIQAIPEEQLSQHCISNGKAVTLAWLIDDYVDHMEHHLQHIIPLP